MFFSKMKKSDIIRISTLIGKKAVIDGNVSGKGNFKIDGAVDGDVNIRGDLVMGETAVVTGNITAKNVIIAGKLVGDIEASGQLTIKSTGTITGSQKCGSLIVEEGSNVVGKCEISGNTEDSDDEGLDSDDNKEETV